MHAYKTYRMLARADSIVRKGNLAHPTSVTIASIP
jgi:hypothetical protein